MATIIVKDSGEVLTGPTLGRIVRGKWGASAQLWPIKDDVRLYLYHVVNTDGIVITTVYAYENPALAQREALARVLEQATYMHATETALKTNTENWHNSIHAAAATGATHQLMADASGKSRSAISSIIKKKGLGA